MAESHDSSSEIRALTGLRGIAALYVAAFHFGIGEQWSGPFYTFGMHGYLGVDIFFVLSGFIMALTYRALFANGFSRDGFKTFMKRRIARVYPLYFVVTVFLILTLPDNPPEGFLSIPVTWWTSLNNLLLIQSWGFGKSYVLPGWSISTELAAYLLFPALLGITYFCSKRRAILSGLVAVILLVLLAVLPEGFLNLTHEKGPLHIWIGNGPGPLVRCLAEFVFGLLACRVFLEGRPDGILRHKFTALALLCALCGVLMIPNSDVLAVLLIPPLLIALADDQGPGARVLGWGPVHWLGLISYSFYLVHYTYPVQLISYALGHALDTLVFDGAMPHWKLNLIGIQILVSLVLAAGTYYLIEKPGRLIVRALLGAGRKAPVC